MRVAARVNQELMFCDLPRFSYTEVSKVLATTNENGSHITGYATHRDWLLILLRIRISYILKSIDHAIFVQNAASLDSCKNFGNRSTVSLLCIYLQQKEY